MRLVEVLQITGAILGILATVFMGIEQRLISRFRRAGAMSPQTSMTPPSFKLFLRWRLSRLRSAGVVVYIDSHRIYLDETVYLSHRKKRAVLGISLVVFAILVVVMVHRALSG